MELAQVKSKKLQVVILAVLGKIKRSIMLLFIFFTKKTANRYNYLQVFCNREGELVKSIKERGLKEDSKGFIIYIIFIFVLAFIIFLLIPDVHHHLNLWLNNIFSNFELAVDTKLIETSETKGDNPNNLSRITW